MRRHKTNQKLMAMILSITMVVGMTPVSVLASEEADSGLDSAGVVDTVYSTMPNADTVSGSAIGVDEIAVTAFDALPDELRWQNTIAPEFPETVGGTVEGEAAQIPVTWEADHDYDEESPVSGLYVFTAVLGGGYEAAYDVELPRMTIYISQTVGGRMARMAGGGTADSPLEITTSAQLAEIATLVNARENGLELFLFNDADAKVSLKMMNDIDLSAYAKGGGWVPIGGASNPFKGAFDGSGHKISNLTIDRSGMDHQGLFGYIGVGSLVKKLGIENINILAKGYVGGVVGEVRGGTVQNCYTTGSVDSGTYYAGGVAGGVFDNGTLQNCYTNVSIDGTSGTFSFMIGGLVGGVYDSSVINCYVTGSVIGHSSSSSTYTGGVTGYLVGESTLQDCAALNPAVSGRDRVGRVVGNWPSDFPVGNRWLSGNIAFGGMTVTKHGSIIIPPAEGADQTDGESKAAADIKEADFFETLFGNDTAWTYAEGKLPGFGAAIAMPAHITGTSDSNFRGAGTSEDPYQIATAAQLAKLSELVTAGDPSYHSAHYKLMNDLDLSAYGVAVDGKGWSPIGWGSSNPFGGSFDGNGKTVSGLSANSGMNSCIGLFGFVSGAVENLSVVDVNLRSGGYMGGIAGYVSGTVKNCSSSGSIIGIGRFNGGIVGGLTGTVENCYSTAVVSGSDENGGVAGYVNGGRIINCAALGPSVGGAPNSGRVSGATYSATISGNIAFSGMTVNGSIVSGGTSTGKQGTPKTVAEIGAEGFFEALFVGDPVWTYEKNKLPGFGEAVSMPTHLIETGAVPFDGTGISESDPYLIKTATDLAKLAELVNDGISPYANGGRYYKLVNDLDLSGYTKGTGWTPIGTSVNAFKGSFDGNDKSITGLTVNRPTTDDIGLFGYLYPGSKVLNIRIIGANVSGKTHVGGVVGYAWGASVENCAVSGSISGVNRVGGTVGVASSGTVQKCYSSGSVTGSGDYVGGIVGYLEYAATTVQRCYSDSSVSGSNYVGGVAGEVGDGSVQNCYSTGNVTGSRYVGGVAGSIGSGSVQNCYSTGSISGTDSEGYIGGVLGVLNGGTAKNCVALNPSIVAGTYNYGRVVGGSSSGILLNNYAFSRIPGTWANKGLSAKDGVDVTVQTLFSANFWTMPTYWDTSEWDGMVWMCAGDKLPVLFGLFGLAAQSGDGGLYLTARDIRYATVTPSATSYTYNGSEQVPTVTVTFDGETLTKDTDYTITITSMDGSDGSAGTNAGEVTLTITGISGFSGTKTLTYTIAPKPITITDVAATNRDYDGTTAVALSGGALSGVMSGDTGNISFTLGTGMIADKNTENGKAVTTSIQLIGSAAYNYILAQPTGITVNITKKPLPPTSATAEDKEYDGDTDATVTGVVFSGLVGDESLTLGTDCMVTGSFGNAYIGTNKTVTVTVTLNSTEKANNYSISDTVNTTASITAKQIEGTVTIDVMQGSGDANKIDEGDTLTANISGITSGATLSYQWHRGGTEISGATSNTYRIAARSTNPVGSLITVTVTGTGNYAGDITSAAVEIDKIPLGGGVSSGDSMTTPVTITPEIKPNQPVTALAPVTATVGTNGTASAAIPDKTITDAIAKAQADAKAQDKTANGIGVSIRLSNPENTKSLGIVLTQAVLKQLVDGKVQQFEIDSKLLTIAFDQEAIKEIRKQSTGDVTITVTPVTISGVRNACNITISYTKGGKIVNVTSLGNGVVTFSIPYTPGKNEAAGYLFAVYVDDKGKVSRIADSAYDVNSRSIIFTTTHFSLYGIGYTAPSAKFTDISSHWGKEAIDYVVGRGLLSGASDTTFVPNNAMTRGMLVAALGRLAGVDVKTYTANSFTDVKADSAFRPYIEWAYSKGVVQGIGNQQFAPDRAITREEIAVIFTNYAKANGYKLPVTREATTYADASSIDSAYKTAVTAMQQAGIMMGGTGNKFNPKGNATRAEVSSMLHRYIKLTIDPDTAQGWALNDAGQYLYYKDGKALTGTQTISGMKYFFNNDGTLKIGWVKDGENWRCYPGNKAATGWLDISDKRYYFTKDGLMVLGKWLEIDGKWYYFNADGSLAKSTKVDGYEIDENGVKKLSKL